MRASVARLLLKNDLKIKKSNFLTWPIELLDDDDDVCTVREGSGVIFGPGGGFGT